VPRVRPKQARFQPDQLVKSWQAFSTDLAGVAYTIRRGTQLRGDHEVVQAAPWNFIPAEAGDDELPPQYPSLPEPEPARFSGPQKIKLKVPVLSGSAKYEPGQLAEFPAGTAEWLCSENYAEPA
jgi:hypothetical protein